MKTMNTYSERNGKAKVILGGYKYPEDTTSVPGKSRLEERRKYLREFAELNKTGHRRMNPNEVDRCAGLFFSKTEAGNITAGDHTDAPEATEGDRRAAIGNSIMITTYLFLFSFLPPLTRPGAALPLAARPSLGSPAFGQSVRLRGEGKRLGADDLTSSDRPCKIPFPFQNDEPQVTSSDMEVDSDEEDEAISSPDPQPCTAMQIDRASRAWNAPPPINTASTLEREANHHSESRMQES